MTVSKSDNGYNLGLTTEEIYANIFKIVGSKYNNVKVSTLFEGIELFWTSSSTDDLIDLKTYQNENQDFLVLFNFGENLIQIFNSQENRKMSFDENTVKLVKARIGESTVLLPNCSEAPCGSIFMIMPETNDTKFYLSLNYILNSLRFENQESKLIRGSGEILNSMLLENMKEALIETHVSDYCFALLSGSFFKKLCQPCEDRNHMRQIIDELISANQEFMNKIEKHNQASRPHPAISRDMYTKYLEDLKQHLGNEVDTIKEYWILDKVLGWILNNVVNPAELEGVFNIIDANLLSFSKKLSDTFNIIDTCLQKFNDENSPAVDSGHMAIVRVTSIDHGNLFKQSMCIARQVSKDFNLEIIQDYDSKSSLNAHMDISIREAVERQNPQELRILKKIQVDECEKTNRDGFRVCECRTYSSNRDDPYDLKCITCKHIHREFKSYGDLIGLPCLLILVNKGRMGDTFPDSLIALDDRANHVPKLNRGTSPWLTTFAQEKGRMCRYTTRNSKLPILYISENLFNDIERSLRKDCTYYRSFLDRRSIDEYVKYNEKDFSLHATSGHIDAINDHKPRKNHFLLTAEPQCGKTGAYLHLIALLREKIEDPPIEIEEDSDEDDEVDEFPDFSNEFQRLVPHWKKLQEMTLPTTISTQSKYLRWTGRYTYPVENPPNFIEYACNNEPRRRQTPGQSRFMSGARHSITHKANHSEECCSFEVPQEDIVLSDVPSIPSNESIIISIPCKRHYKDLLSTRISDSSLVHLMTPSYRRASSARLNWNHLFIRDGQIQPFIHFVFVRKSEFRRYKQIWGNYVGLVQLPDKMDDLGDMTVSNGGIGFARRFIQRFCHYFKIKWLYMCDDTIIYINKKTDETDMLQVNEDFMKIGSGVEDVPNEIRYQKHPDLQESNKIESYSGPRQEFAIIGVKKRNRYPPRRFWPYSKRHCHSFMWLNNDLLMEQDVLFEAWPVWEDLKFCNDADSKSLHVIKINSFELTKVPSRDSPLLYMWKDEDFKNLHATTQQVEELHVQKLLLRFLKSIKIKRFHREEGNDANQFFDEIQNLNILETNSTSIPVIIRTSFPSFDFYKEGESQYLLILPLTDRLYCQYRNLAHLKKEFPQNLERLTLCSTYKPRIKNDYWVLHLIFKTKTLPPVVPPNNDIMLHQILEELRCLRREVSVVRQDVNEIKLQGRKSTSKVTKKKTNANVSMPSIRSFFQKTGGSPSKDGKTICHLYVNITNKFYLNNICLFQIQL